VIDITLRVTSTTSTTPGWSMITPTAMLRSSSCRTPAPRGNSQMDTMCHVVSSLRCSTACISTPPSSLENLHNLIPNPEARATVTYWLPMRCTKRNQRLGQW
jgi:hypothetical protein